MKIIRTRQFLKMYKKCQNKVQKQFRERVLLFVKDPTHPKLRLHKLKGQYKDFLSIDIAGDMRVILQMQVVSGQQVCVFHAIGTHAQLYK